MNEIEALKSVLESYAPITEQTWNNIEKICTFVTVDKGCDFCKAGNVPKYFGFVCSGLLRAYTVDQKGNEYNKVFFPENTFPGSMVALLTSSPSRFTIESLERSHILQIDFKAYRELLWGNNDLMKFHIRYLEKNWLITNEGREIRLVQESAAQRYLRFKNDHPGLESRLSQYHIASHLGITPTQLSRIRKKLKNANEKL